MNNENNENVLEPEFNNDDEIVEGEFVEEFENQFSEELSETEESSSGDEDKDEIVSGAMLFKTRSNQIIMRTYEDLDIIDLSAFASYLNALNEKEWNMRLTQGNTKDDE